MPKPCYKYCMYISELCNSVFLWYCVVFKDLITLQKKIVRVCRRTSTRSCQETDRQYHIAFNGHSPPHFSVCFPLFSNKQDAAGAWLANAAEEWGQIAEGALCGRDLSVFSAVPVFVFRAPLNPLWLPLLSTSQAFSWRWLNQNYSILCRYNPYNHDYQIICARNQKSINEIKANRFSHSYLNR